MNVFHLRENGVRWLSSSAGIQEFFSMISDLHQLCLLLPELCSFPPGKHTNHKVWTRQLVGRQVMKTCPFPSSIYPRWWFYVWIPAQYFRNLASDLRWTTEINLLTWPIAIAYLLILYQSVSHCRCSKYCFHMLSMFILS